MSPRSALRAPARRVFAVALACTLPLATATTVARGAGCPCGSMADEFRAAEAGLVREWIVQAPFDSGRWRLTAAVVSDDLVLVQAGDGGVHAIRADGVPGDRAGTVAWSHALPSATGHAWPPTIGSQLVVVTSDRLVQALDPETGAVVWERPTDALTAGSATQAGAWVYVPLETGRILRLPTDPFARSRSATSSTTEVAADERGAVAILPSVPSESLEPLSIDASGHAISSPVPFGDGVIWGTDRGLVALDATAAGWIRHAFPQPPAAPAAFLGPPVVARDGIFVVTSEGILARIVLNAPQHRGLWTAWSASLPDRPVAAPLVADGTVLVTLGPSGIAAFDAADGRERWKTDLVGTVVAVAGGRAWVLDETSRLVALDLASGVRRGAWCLGCFSLPVVATGSGRILLASPSGLVALLAPPDPPAAQSTVSADGSPAPRSEPAGPAATLP